MRENEGIKAMRAELGLTQNDLAAALHMSYSTINRWENGKSVPNPATRLLVMNYAKEKGVSRSCTKRLEASFAFFKNYDKNGSIEKNIKFDNELQIQLAYESETAVYVVDYVTDELIYFDPTCTKIFNLEPEECIGKKCYEKLMNQNKTCLFCQKENLKQDGFVSNIVMSPNNKQEYLIKSKLLMWNGRKVHAHFVSNEIITTNQQQDIITAINKIPAGIGIFYVYENGNMEIRYLNDEYYDMVESTREKRSRYFGPNAASALHPYDAVLLKNELQQVIGQEKQLNTEIRIQKDNGEYKWFSLKADIIKKSASVNILYCAFLDIDQLKNTQQELEGKSTMLYEAMKNADVMTWKYNYVSHRVTDTGSWGEVHHFPKVMEDFPECFIASGIILEESMEDFKKIYRELPNQQEVVATIKMISKSKKGYAWNKIIHRNLYDKNGKYLETVVTSVDVTDQKDRELHYEEEIRIKKMVAHNLRVIAVFNLSQNTVEESESEDAVIRECLSLKKVDDVLEAVCTRYIVPSEQQEYRLNFSRKKMLEQYSMGIMHGSFRHHQVELNGWYESSYDLVENPYNNEIEAIVSLKDVSDLVRAEQTVDTLMKTDYTSIMIIDAVTGCPTPFMKLGKIADIIKEQKTAGDNVAGVEAYVRKHCIDADVDKVVRETSLPYVKEKLEKQNSFSTSYSIKIDGKIIHKRTIYAYLDSSKRTIICAMQDLTDSYMQEEEQKRKMEEAMNMAAQANKAKTEFFSRMSHDMRTPMNGILGITELSMEEENAEELRKNIGQIHEIGKYLLGLINDTLDFQRIESGRMNISPEIVKTKSFMNSVTEMFHFQAVKKNIDFKVKNRNCNLEGYVKVDPVRMKQVFVNLLSNAMKFTPNGGTVSLEMETVDRREKISTIRFKVIDNGIGMGKDFLTKKIFKPFSQESSEVTSQYAGSGLGLSIVYKLIELMNGTIRVESEQNKGTTFTICIDVECIEQEDVQKENENEAEKESKFRKKLQDKRILLVEDHPLNAEIAKRLLEKMSCKVIWAENGKLGVDSFMKAPLHYYDMILMDVRMPVMDGLLATRKIRASKKEEAKTIPIIAMTANAYERDVKDTIEAGMNAHLKKPIIPIQLYETMIHFLNAKQ